MREIMTELRLIKEDEEVVIYLNGVPADIILTMVLAIDRLASLTKTPHDKIIKAIEETLPEVNMQLQSKDEQIIDRLAEYENTGLEPKEVQLIANVLREVGETYNCHFNFVVKALKEYANANEKGKRKAKEWERMVDAHGTLEGWLCPCGFSSGGAWSYCSGCGSEMYGGEKHED